MSETSKSNTGKVVGGCCLGLAVVGLIVGGIAVFLGKKGFEMAQEEMADGARAEAVLAAWNEAASNSEAPPFPETFEGLPLAEVEPIDVLPLPGLDVMPGHRGDFGDGAITCYVFPVAPGQDVTSMMNSASEGSSTRMSVNLPGHSRTSFSKDGKHHYLHAQSDWLFYIVSQQKLRGRESLVQFLEAAVPE